MTENEEGMRGLMARWERYVEEKRFKVNTSKTKIMRYRKERGRRKKIK